jgi:hypothetical protein
MLPDNTPRRAADPNSHSVTDVVAVVSSNLRRLGDRWRGSGLGCQLLNLNE